jgi:SAM-dependent methyltransferase
MDPILCRVCRGQVEFVHVGGTPFDRCTSCGYAVLRSRSSSREYWAHGAQGELEFWTTWKEAYFLSTLELLSELTAGRRLIDVGGGVGYFAELALEHGWNASSSDVSEVAQKAAADRVGKDRSLRSLETVETGSFDVATLWCVVAHVDDPVALARDVARVLRPGGLIWLTSPNFVFHRRYAAVRRVAGRPIDFGRDDHRGQFTPAALSVLLRRVGFGVPTWQYRGITELCSATMRTGGAGVTAKRAWNRTAEALVRLGLPNVMSELQLTARRRNQRSSTPSAIRRI